MTPHDLSTPESILEFIRLYMPRGDWRGPYLRNRQGACPIGAAIQAVTGDGDNLCYPWAAVRTYLGRGLTKAEDTAIFAIVNAADNGVGPLATSLRTLAYGLDPDRVSV
jgi:hypothetical protein